MHRGKPGSWCTWAYHSRRWSSHIWRTSEATVCGVCLPISNSALLRKISLGHKTTIDTLTVTLNENRYTWNSHMDHLSVIEYETPKTYQITDQQGLSLFITTWLCNVKERNRCLILGQKFKMNKGYWIGLHSWEKCFFVRCLARCLSVAFYFQNFQISLCTEIHMTDRKFTHFLIITINMCILNSVKFLISLSKNA